MCYLISSRFIIQQKKESLKIHIQFSTIYIHLELNNPHFFVCIGSSTACVLILNRENSTVYTANIGDSGFIVVREGTIVHRSEEQQHYFNTPFQLSLPPPGHGDNVLSDSPESADSLSFPVLDGDVILVATDGVFDNVPIKLLLDSLKEVYRIHFCLNNIGIIPFFYCVVRGRAGPSKITDEGELDCADGPFIVI